MRKRILIVADHPDCREILAVRVRSMGNEALKANNGEEALTKAVNEPPDLIIFDLGLSDISGIEVVMRLKQEPATSDIPVVLHSAWECEEWQEKGFEVGVAEFLVKPALPSKLRETIERLTKLNSHEESRAKEAAGVKTQDAQTPQFLRYLLSKMPHRRGPLQIRPRPSWHSLNMNFSSLAGRESRNNFH